VVAAFAAEDLESTLRPLPVRYEPGRLYDWQLLARSSVSYVGEPLAVVVGTNRAAVEEAIDLADIEYEPLSPVVDVEKAREGSPGVVRPEVGTNVLFSLRREKGDVDGALANAEFVIERRYHLGRHSASPLENRGILAYADTVTGELVVCTSTQVPHIVRQAIATVLGRREDSVRVLVPDVGGGFGVKAQVGAEECVVACLAQHLGRRVAWIEDRWENLAASNHAHDEWLRLTVGFTGSGLITGMDAEVLVDVGAHSSYPLSAALEPATVSSHLFGCYRMPAARLAAFGVTTNKCPTGAYRGVGASVASFATERLLDDAAAEIGLSRAEIRRRNLLGRADMPYHHAIGGRMDRSDPLGVFDRLLTSLDSAEPWLASAVKARAGRWQEPGPGPLVGIGLAVCAEHSAPGSADYRGRGVTEVPGYDSARVVFEEVGTFTVYISSAEAGQRHAAVCRRQVAAVLGVDLRLVRVVEGDTAACPVGSGTFASRFAAKQVTAALAGASRMAERLRLAAASYLGCSSSEVRQAEGGYEHPASGGQVSLAKLGEWLYRPPGATPVHSSGVPVEELGCADGEAALSCGALLTVVEVDPQSFVTKVRAMSIVEECGRVLDHDLAVGQLVGGAVMGLGDALLEEHRYDDLGQITTSSLMDYLLPSFGDAPRIKVSLLEDESLYTEHSRTGSKGVGEGGTIGAVAAIGCALSDALAPLGATLNELPGTPQRLFRACGNPATPNSRVDQLGGESAPSPHEYRLR
jgi:aerobic carbon-monoxide dehydrogenase large subunit